MINDSSLIAGQCNCIHRQFKNLKVHTYDTYSRNHKTDQTEHRKRGRNDLEFRCENVARVVARVTCLACALVPSAEDMQMTILYLNDDLT